MARRRPKYMDRVVETLCCPFCSGERVNAAPHHPTTVRRGDRFCANCGRPWPPHQVIRSNECYSNWIELYFAEETRFDAVAYVKESLLAKAVQDGAIPCGFWIMEVRHTAPCWNDTQIEVLLYVHGGRAPRPLPVGGDPRFIDG